jgi:hypothetical protein
MRVLSGGRARLVALVVVAAAVGAGIAYANIPDSQGVIHGCYSPNGAKGSNGTPLNIVNSDVAACSKGQTEVTWSQTGPQGPPGQNGAAGTSVTSTSVGTGDTNCPTGGSQFTAGTSVTYACNGAKGDKGDTGAAGPSAAFTDYGDGTHTFGTGLTQTITSLTLPVGSYILSASVSVGKNQDDDTHASCSFVSAGALNAQGALASLEGIFQVRMPLIGDVTVTSNNTSVFLQCTALDGSISAAGEMNAIKVGSITASP